MRRWRFVAGREISVKKYVVKLSAEERERLEAMICAGKHPAQSLTKARILLKADVSEAGEGWSDSAISAALDTSINNIGRANDLYLAQESVAERRQLPICDARLGVRPMGRADDA